MFLGRAIGGQLKVQADGESLRAGWFRLTEIDTLPLRHPEVKDWIQAAERVRNCPVPTFTCYTPGMVQKTTQKQDVGKETNGLGREEVGGP